MYLDLYFVIQNSYESNVPSSLSKLSHVVPMLSGQSWVDARARGNKRFKCLLSPNALRVKDTRDDYIIISCYDSNEEYEQ
jgi:hypothetical protein